MPNKRKAVQLKLASLSKGGHTHLVIWVPFNDDDDEKV